MSMIQTTTTTFNIDRLTPSIIVNPCNNIGAWASPFAQTLSEVDSHPQDAYVQWHADGETRSGIPFAMSEIQLCRFADHIVANILVKNGVTPEGKTIEPVLNYEALQVCFEKLTLIAQKTMMPVLIPKFANADWRAIEEIIEDTLIAHDIDVTIYLQEGK